MRSSGSARAVPFVNWPVDVLVIGGLSLAALPLFYGLQASGHPDPVPQLGFWLGWVVNWPHFSASSYRLYHSRSNIEQYPVTALGIPFLIAAAAVGAFLAPVTAGAALVKLYLLWSPYHFAGQSLGITLIYARRAGIRVGRLERAAASSFIWSTYVCLILIQETGQGLMNFGGVAVPLLGLPIWVLTASSATVGIFGVAFLATFGRACRQAGARGAFLVLLPAATQLAWLLGAYLPAYQALVPMFHSLQYLLIAWVMQLKERLDLQKAAPSWRFAGRESLKWGVLNLLGGALLFWAIPRMVAWTGRPLTLTVPVLFSAFQIHHFFVDGVIWKLRNPKVGSPLLVDLETLVASPAGLEPAAA